MHNKQKETHLRSAVETESSDGCVENQEVAPQAQIGSLAARTFHPRILRFTSHHLPSSRPCTPPKSTDHPHSRIASAKLTSRRRRASEELVCSATPVDLVKPWGVVHVIAVVVVHQGNDLGSDLTDLRDTNAADRFARNVFVSSDVVAMNNRDRQSRSKSERIMGS